MLGYRQVADGFYVIPGLFDPVLSDQES